MFDQILAKEAVFQKLIEAGYSQEETEAHWKAFQNMFSVQLFNNAYNLIPPEVAVQVVGTDQISIQESPEAIKKLGEHLVSHIDEYNLSEVLKKSVVEAAELFKKYLSE